jgi:transcriptional regulator with XRE-family HTH domain
MHGVLVNRARIIYDNGHMEANLSEAVKELRKILGLSQQAFATELGMSIRAVVNYEKDRAPAAKALAQLEKLASEHEQSELARTFRNALGTQLGLSTSDRPQLSAEELYFDRAFRRCVFENPKSAAAAQIRKLLRPYIEQIKAEDGYSVRIRARSRKND